MSHPPVYTKTKNSKNRPKIMKSFPAQTTTSQPPARHLTARSTRFIANGAFLPCAQRMECIRLAGALRHPAPLHRYHQADLPGDASHIAVRRSLLPSSFPGFFIKSRSALIPPNPQNPQHLKANQATDLTVVNHATQETHVPVQPHHPLSASSLAQSRPVSLNKLKTFPPPIQSGLTFVAFQCLSRHFADNLLTPLDKPPFRDEKKSDPPSTGILFLARARHWRPGA
jgi:hypothetical protein